MRIVLLITLTFFISDIFGQSSKKENENKLNAIQFELDSVKEYLTKQIEIQKNKIDSLLEENKVKIPVPKNQKVKQKAELKLTCTFVNGIQWSLTNLGGVSSANNFDVENVRNFLSENGFSECTDDESWSNFIDQEIPAFLIANEPYSSMGYMFNKHAIIKLQELLQNTEWKIAEYSDFNNLYLHASNLKLKNYTPFQLIVGNPKTNDVALKKYCSWTNQTIIDIYGLNILPLTYFNGYHSYLKNESYVEYFSHFNESGNVVVTHIDPDNKFSPLDYNYGSESSKYGFFIRLIKK